MQRRGGERVPCRRIDVENVALLETDIGETSTNGLGGLSEFGKCEILELAELEIGPLLLLFDLFAPHHLGDLLFLKVGVYDVAVADGVFVPVRAIDVCKDVVDGVDTVHGACCELTLGNKEVPANLALALVGFWTNFYGTWTEVDHDAWKGNGNKGKGGGGRESQQRCGGRVGF